MKPRFGYARHADAEAAFAEGAYTFGDATGPMQQATLRDSSRLSRRPPRDRSETK